MLACLTTTTTSTHAATSGGLASAGDRVITTMAGGLPEGPATSISNSLSHLAAAGSTLYASDFTFDVVRAIDLETGYERVVAGTGSDDGFYGDGGPAQEAGLSGPGSIAVDPTGNLLIVEARNDRVRKVTPAGTITTVAGGGPPGANGEGGPATRADIDPTSIAVDRQGNVYLTERGLVRKIDTAGIITTIAGGAGPPLIDGQPARDRALSGPAGAIAVDDAGNVYFVERQYIWRIDPQGIAWPVRRISGDTSHREWDWPTALRTRPDGTLLVLVRTQVLAVDAAGTTTALVGDGTFGFGGDGGPATSAQLSHPTDIELDGAGNLYVANSAVRKVDTGGTITRITSNDGSTAAWEGKPAVKVHLYDPNAVAVGRDGNVYVAEYGYGRLRRVDRSGVVTTVSGGGTGVRPADGVPARSAAINAKALAMSPTGTLYFADDEQVFRIDEGGVLRLVAGVAGVPCYWYADCATGDGGPATAAQIWGTSGLAVAADGTVFITSQTSHRLRRIDPSGVITTVAGSPMPGFSGDGGPARAAQLHSPRSVQLDAWGNLYFVDYINFRVRKVDPAGVITTVAGSGVARHGTDAGLATSVAMSPWSIVLDPRGNLFMADGPRIRMVDVHGRITTVAGVGSPGFWGDGGPPLSAALGVQLESLAVDGAGNLLVADTRNRRIRRITGVADLTPPGPPQAWGWNAMGQVGGGAGQVSLPVDSGGPNGFTQVAASAGHTLGRRSDGTAWAWGWNSVGQVGDGSVTDRRSPARIGGTALTGVTQVAAGALHSLALRSDGTVWTWGWNGFGQLGTGTTVTRATPAPVPGLSRVVAVAGGAYHSLAVRADGTVWAWGWNGLGQLGDGTTTDRLAPTPVPGLTGAVTVAAGLYHSLALRSDGTARAWGWNGVGQLGDGTTTTRLLPSRVSGLTGVVAIAGGAYHSLAVTSDGSAWAWGWNRFGQLGDGTTADRYAATRVPALTAVRKLSGGWFHSIAIGSNGSIRSWGLNHVGQLGDGTLVDRHSPVTVVASGRMTGAGGGYHSVAA